MKYIDKTYHQILLKSVFIFLFYFIFLTKFFNKSFHLKGISQHLYNEQNLNTGKYTDL